MNELRFLYVPPEAFAAWKAGRLTDADFAAAITPSDPAIVDELRAISERLEKPPRLSKRHQKVLLAMAEYDRQEQISPFRSLAIDTGIEFQLVRIAVRALARRGFARLTRGLINIDGEFCGGSGYGLTDAGRQLAAKIGGDA